MLQQLSYHTTIFYVVKPNLCEIEENLNLDRYFNLTRNYEKGKVDFLTQRKKKKNGCHHIHVIIVLTKTPPRGVYCSFAVVATRDNHVSAAYVSIDSK